MSAGQPEQIFVLRRTSSRMPDFTTVSVGDTIKLSADLTVVVLRIESSDAMLVRALTVDELAAQGLSHAKA